MGSSVHGVVELRKFHILIPVTREFLRALDVWIPTISSMSEIPHVPEILARRGGEFCATAGTDPQTVAAVCRQGFIPMGLAHPVAPLLLIKLHQHRCILRFEDVHTSRNARRYARDLTMTVDRDFFGTIQTLVSFYRDRWLIPDLVNALVELHHDPRDGVQAHSVEVYHQGRVVAGEVGYSLGAVYTSLSGFHRKNGAGTVQLLSLSHVLKEAGYAFWDMGMEAEYKTRLGATLMAREEFLSLYHSCARDRALPGPAAGEGTLPEDAPRYGDGARPGDRPLSGDRPHPGIATLPIPPGPWDCAGIVRRWWNEENRR